MLIIGNFDFFLCLPTRLFYGNFTTKYSKTYYKSDINCRFLKYFGLLHICEYICIIYNIYYIIHILYGIFIVIEKIKSQKYTYRLFYINV